MARTRELALPRRSQPQGVATVDPSWGLRPEIAWFGSAPSVMRPGAMGTVTGFVTGVSRAGLAITGNGANGNGVTIAGGSTAAHSAATFVAVCRLNGVGGAYQGLISLTGQSGSNKGIYVADDGSGRGLAIVRGGVAGMSAVTSVPSDQWIVVVASWRQSDGYNYVTYSTLDGGAIVESSGTHSGAMLGGDGTYCVGRGRSDIPSWNGDIAMAVASFDWLPLQMARELLRNPWRLLAPMSRREPLPGAAPSGVPDITAVIAESILSDRVSYRATLNYA